MEGATPLRVPKVEVVVLGLLAEEPLYGYDLLELFRARSMGFWVEIGKASVYQTLRRLEERGFITGKAQQGTDGPDRRVYRITRPGRDRLHSGLADRFAELAPYETEAGTALGFAGLLTASELRRALDEREQAVRDLLAAARGERRRDAGQVDRALSDALLERQEALAKAELAWIKTFRVSFGKARRMPNLR
jgi:DNA-binding PadR family transcriptional regulator